MRRGGHGLFWGLTVITYAFGRFQGGFVPWFLFYASLVISVYLTSVVWFSLWEPEVERRLSGHRMTAGERLTVRLRYRRHAPLPPSWVYFEDEGDLKPKEGMGWLRFPGWSRERVFDYVLRDLPRGRHRFQGVKIRSGDLFGLVEKRWDISLVDEIIVYPRIREIRVWHTVNEQNTGRSTPTLRVGEDVTSVVGVRDYSHRDPLSRIHWKATARGQGLKAKEFEHQVSNDFMFVLDCRDSSFEGKGDPLFERAVSLTATLAKFAVGRRFSSGLIAWGNQRLHLPLGRSQEHLLRLFDPLAVIQPEGKMAVGEILVQESAHLPRGTTTIVITPGLSLSDVQAIGQLMLKKIKVEVFWVCHSDALEREERLVLGMLDSLGVRVDLVPHDDFGKITEGGVSLGQGSA